MSKEVNNKRQKNLFFPEGEVVFIGPCIEEFQLVTIPFNLGQEYIAISLLVFSVQSFVSFFIQFVVNIMTVLITQHHTTTIMLDCIHVYLCQCEIRCCVFTYKLSTYLLVHDSLCPVIVISSAIKRETTLTLLSRKSCASISWK